MCGALVWKGAAVQRISPFPVLCSLVSHSRSKIDLLSSPRKMEQQVRLLDLEKRAGGALLEEGAVQCSAFLIGITF